MQGTPGTYLPSHTHVMYGSEGAKSAGGSISLGLPRQQDLAKPGEGNREGGGRREWQSKQGRVKYAMDALFQRILVWRKLKSNSYH